MELLQPVDQLEKLQKRNDATLKDLALSGVQMNLDMIRLRCYIETLLGDRLDEAELKFHTTLAEEVFPEVRSQVNRAKFMSAIQVPSHATPVS